MANKKPSYQKVMLKGIAKYPRLNEPDTKFNPGGDFSVKLIVDEETAAPLVESINNLIDKTYDEKVAKMKEEGKSPALIKKVKKSDPPFVEVYDENDEPTGEVQFNFKMKHTLNLKDGKTEKRWVKMFDAKGHELKGSAKPSVWGGSVLTVAGQLVPFDSPVSGCGVSLRLSAVQINKLVTGGGGDAASYGFGEDGDYEGGEEQEDSPFSDSEGSEQPQGEGEGAPDNEDF